MCKIKLLILLLVSFNLLSCSIRNQNNQNTMFSVGYISGEYDGLILKNILSNYLLSLGLYDQESNFEINTSISHSSNLYITNRDNTSNRTNIVSTLHVEIVDQKKECKVYNFEKDTSQFYVFAESDKYISNNKAEEKIKKENTDSLVKSFINKIYKAKFRCVKDIMLIREKY